MESWGRTTLSLCVFGLSRGLRPSESYKVPFLLGHWRHISQKQLNTEIYPIALYAYAVLLIAVFLLTDLLRYKPIIVLSGICGTLVYSILLWTESLVWLQVSQVFYGLFMATEVAYLTYMFAKVDTAKYAKVSSYTRASTLVGRFISGVSAQLLTTFGFMDYRQLNYITFGAQCASIVLAFMLPSVGFSQYFHRGKKLSEVSLESQSEKAQPCRDMCGGALYLIWRHAKMAYSNPGVVVWSLWYAGFICSFAQIQSYVQLLWTQVDADAKNVYNGAVEAALTLLGACGALAASRCGSGSLAASLAAPLAVLMATAGIVSALTDNIFVSYACYIILGMIYYFSITLSSTQIAQRLGDESCFGLVFGINTLVATALQSLLTSVAISWLGLLIRQQFLVYTSLFGLMGAVWLLGWLYVVSKRCCMSDSLKDEPNNNHENKVIS